MMEKFSRYMPLVLLLTLAACAFSGCGQTGAVTGTSPEIDAAHATISFPASGGWPDVRFSHKAHSEKPSLNNNCLTCHSHTGIRDTTIWNCNSCHSTGDTEALCSNDIVGHGCWMVQCRNCHLTLASDPTPNCIDCHLP